MALSYITAKDIRISGTLKKSPEDFEVEEVPLYLPIGDGQHIYFKIKRVGLNTKDVVKKIRQCFKISEKDIGQAGLKDKQAVTTQWFSVSLGANANVDEATKSLKDFAPELEILETSKHSNKLKLGHLVGNRFKIKVHDLSADAFKVSLGLIEILKETGFPNYYGPQRFGSKGDNQIAGRQIILGEKKVKSHFMKKLLLSAYQSDLFNQWLDSRIKDDLYAELIPGDLLQESDGGRPFPFDSERNHLQEFKEGVISYTGPMFGHKVSTPSDQALEREELILNVEKLTDEILKKYALVGARRSARIFPKELTLTEVDSALVFSFILPSGVYATSIIREFIKTEE